MRLALAIVSTGLEEAALVIIWRWGLPQLGIQLPLYILIIVMAGWAAYAVTTFWIVTRTLRRKAMIGLPTMIGTRGKVAIRLAPAGLVNIRGELWGAESVDGNLEIGELVTVAGQDGLKLVVHKSSGAKSEKSK